MLAAGTKTTKAPPSGMMYSQSPGAAKWGWPPGNQKQSSEFGWSPSAQQQSAQRPAEGSMNAYTNLGTAGMNAMGQYGSTVANSLANQSIAAGNTFGQMANSYYNTMGQLGHVGSALAAAGLTAGANSGRGSMNFGGGGGYGGFDVFGPGGGVASGSMGGGGGGDSGSASFTRGDSPQDRMAMTRQGYGFLNNLRQDMRGGQGGVLANLANDQFTANRKATMNPMFMDSMNGMFTGAQAGIDAQSGFSRPPYGGAPAQIRPYRPGASTRNLY